jgi:PAS domain-containing protein
MDYKNIQTNEDILFTNIILQTEQEASIDGILVVDENGKILSYNKRFVDLWSIPLDVLVSKSDELALKSVVDKLTNPKEFLDKVKYLYDAKEEVSRDEISLIDGRTFDRYSAPMLGENKKYYGRIWYFRDITDRKVAEEKIEHELQEIKEMNNLMVDREMKMIELKKEIDLLRKRVAELEDKNH